MGEAIAVELQAELRQVKSMADHSFNIVLNVGEQYLSQVQTLMGWLQNEVGLVIVDGDLPDSRQGTGRKDKRVRNNA